MIIKNPFKKEEVGSKVEEEDIILSEPQQIKQDYFDLNGMTIEIEPDNKDKLLVYQGKLDKGIATVLLGNQEKNRKQNPKLVAKYVREFQEDKFINNGQGLTFNKEGKMVNGQHRCQAVVEADADIWITYTLNLSELATNTLDIGKKRSLIDTFTIEGIKNPSNMSSVCKMIYLYANHPETDISLRDVTHNDILKEYRAYEDQYKEQFKWLSKRHSSEKVGFSFSTALFMKIQTHRINRDFSRTFMSCLLDQDDREDIYKRANTFCENIKIGQIKSKKRQMHMIEVLIECWNDHVNGNMDSKYTVDTTKTRMLLDFMIP